MEYEPIARGPDAYQQPVTATQIDLMCKAALVDATRVVRATELSLGLYNTTYRLQISDGSDLILRVAPEPARQGRLERELIRNEIAAAPFLAGFGSLVATIVDADLSRTVIGRDYLVQTCLEGIPAAGGLDQYPRPAWASFYRRLGAITAQLHAIRGERFGPAGSPVFTSWSDAVLAAFDDTVADLDDRGVDADDLRAARNLADRHRATLDEITEPRLLHGDLWTVNVLIHPDAPEPTITGICDWDRASWGDPLSDWGIWLAASRPGTEREAFWEAYPRQDGDASSQIRSLIYRARDIGAIRLERRRLGRDVPQTYADLQSVLAVLSGLTPLPRS